MVRFGRHPNGSGDIKRRFFSLPALVSMALAAGFLVFLVTRFDVDLAVTWRLVKGSNPWFLVSAVLVHYTTFIFRGARWRLLLQNAQEQNAPEQNAPEQNTQESGAPVPGVLYCSQLVLLGWFANSVGWLRLGDAYRAYLYREEQKASFSRTIGTILAERVLDTVLVVLLLAAVVPFLVTAGGGAARTVLWVAAPVAALVAVLAAVLAVMSWGRGWALGKLPGWLGERYSPFYQGTLGSFQRIVPVTLLGVVAWMAEVARLYLVVRALGLNLGFPLVVFLTLANSLLTLVPTPGGVGAVESGVAGMAVQLSKLSASVAAAMVVVDRAITYVSIIVAGALLFLGREALHRRAAVRGPVRLGEIEDE